MNNIYSIPGSKFVLKHPENLIFDSSGELCDHNTPVQTVKKRRVRKKKPQRPEEKTVPLAWLKSVVSGLDIGKKVSSKKRDKPHPIHLNENEDVLEHFRRLKDSLPSWLKHRWSKKLIEDHCRDKETYYFAGAGESSKPYALVMIDVDCHKSGTREGALKYLEFLREKHYPGLYFEVSTNGNGGHGFLLVDKVGMGVPGVRDHLRYRLAPWLDSLAADFDVEFVEIKGLPPEIVWGDEKFEAKSYTAGTLAKVPRGLIDRFEELRNTAVITATDLHRLPFIERSEPQRTSTKGAVVGSISGKHFREEHLAGLGVGGRFYAIASALLADHEVSTSGRQVVSVDDVAIFLMTGEFFTNNPNSNGTLPTARWAEIWKALFSAGDIDRGWDHKRYAAIRNLLSSLGLIDWEDSSFCIGHKNLDGEYVKGSAAKWCFGAELMEMLAKAGEIEEVQESTGERERKKHPLWEQALTTFTSSLIQAPESETIRPHWTISLHDYRISPEEISQYVGDLTTIAA